MSAAEVIDMAGAAVAAPVPPFNLSAFAVGAPDVVRLGFSPIRIRAGEKRPFGKEWQHYCRTPATPAEVAEWSRWRFGLGIACGTIVDGLQVVAIDVDLAGDELEQALASLPASPMEKFGAKGLTRFFLADPDLPSRKYVRPWPDGRKGYETMVDFQADTKQVVVPPTVHPATGRSYQWVRGPIAARDLPVLTAPELERFEDTLRHLRWDEKIAGKAADRQEPNDHVDEHESIWENVNARALADISWALDPDLAGAAGLYDARREGDRIVAVPAWRAGGTGNPLERRKHSLSIHASGIRDFGEGVGYSPLGLVRVALGLPDDAKGRDDAFRWLSDKTGLSAELDIIPIEFLAAMEDKSRREAEARLAARAEAATTAAQVASSPVVLPSRLTWDDREANEASRLPWLVKGLFPARGVSLLWGQSGAGKSFMALELAACTITGEPFFGHRVKAPGGVLFALGEGSGSIPDRLNALRFGRFGGEAPADPVHGGTLDPDRLPIVTAPVSSLSVATQWNSFAKLVREAAWDMEARHRRKLRLVVVDTVVASFGFEDDPDASKVTKAMKAMDDLAQEMDLLFVPVHHAGKSKAAGEHGSYAWRGSAETSLEVDAKRDEETKVVTGRHLKLIKSRHGGNEGWNAPFELRSITLGIDEDGDPIESAFVAPWQPGANDNDEPQIGSPGATRFMEALAVVYEHASVEVIRDEATVRVAQMRHVQTEYRNRRHGQKLESVDKAYRRDLDSAKAGNLVSTFEQGGERYATPISSMH